MKKYHSVEQHKSTVQIGMDIIKRFPLSEQYPDIMTVQASSYEALKLEGRRIDILEKVALLLPQNSLWRHKISNPSAIRNMEKVSANAAESVAIWNFERGMANDNHVKLIKSASMYKLLVDHSPASKNYIKWNLRRAHSLLYADKLDMAERLYKEAKTNLAITSDQLQIASYQLVITRERKWRKAYNQSVELEQDEQIAKSANENLTNYAKATIEFVDRYPRQSRSTDLLLSLAGAYRDQGQTSNAHEIWQRVLVSTTGVEKGHLLSAGSLFSHRKQGYRRSINFS